MWVFPYTSKLNFDNKTHSDQRQSASLILRYKTHTENKKNVFKYNQVSFIYKELSYIIYREMKEIEIITLIHAARSHIKIYVGNNEMNINEK